MKPLTARQMRFPRAVAPLLIGSVCLGSVPRIGHAQPADPPPATMDAAGRRAVIERLAQLFGAEYALPDVGQRVSDTLRARLARGEYDAFPDGSSLVAALTRDLVETTRDQHLQVFHSAAPRAWVPDANESPEDRRRREEEAHRAGRQDNFGFPEAKILAGNVGYLRLSRLPPPDLSGETATAAMRFLAHSDALILDLRSTGGGHYDTVALLASYLLGPEPVHLSTIHHREGDRQDQLWTLSHVPGPRLLAQPVYVLTSSRTFSAPEQLAYDLQGLGRAAVVGERTRGGALPGRTFEIDPHFAAWISTGVPVSPVTGTNWEGTGVEPDVAVPAERALARAHGEAVGQIAESVADASERRRLTWIADRLRAQAESFSVAESVLRRYAGDYGPRTVRYGDGELFYLHQHGDESRYRLIALAEDLFTLDGVDGYRIRFERDERNRVVRLIGLPVNGPPDPSPRGR